MPTFCWEVPSSLFRPFSNSSQVNFNFLFIARGTVLFQTGNMCEAFASLKQVIFTYFGQIDNDQAGNNCYKFGFSAFEL